jgi:hypothetical protein
MLLYIINYRHKWFYETGHRGDIHQTLYNNVTTIWKIGVS